MAKVWAAFAAAALWLAASSAFAADDGSAEWQRTLAAANQEGELDLQSMPNEAGRNFVATEFAKAFPQIKLSMSVLPAPQFIARIRTERQTDHYLWDVAFTGPPAGYVLAHDGILDPVVPEFVDPAIKDPATWGGWDDAFVDAEKKFVFAPNKFIAGPWYNAAFIPPDKAARDGLKTLIDPAYAGKLAWHDPTQPGSGQGFAVLIRAKLGDAGLKKLVVDQKIAFFEQDFQVVEAVARGTAWIAMGPPVRSLLAPYTQAGAGVKTDMRAFGTGPDANIASIGGSALFVFNKRPHPNATRVFVNWVLSKDVQHALAKVLDADSRRVDVPSTSAPDRVPEKGVKYLAPQSEAEGAALQDTIRLVDEWRKSRP